MRHEEVTLILHTSSFMRSLSRTGCPGTLKDFHRAKVDQRIWITGAELRFNPVDIIRKIKV